MPFGCAGSVEVPSGRTVAGTCGGSIATELTTPPLMSASSPRPNAFFCMVEIHLLWRVFTRKWNDLSSRNAGWPSFHVPLGDGDAAADAEGFRRNSQAGRGLLALVFVEVDLANDLAHQLVVDLRFG